MLSFDVLEDLQRKGIGAAMYKKTYEYFSSKYQIKGIQGIWLKPSMMPSGTSVNYTEFWKTYAAKGKNAVFDTPTGRWAEKNGFTEVNLQIPKVSGESITVLFSIPK